VNIKLHISLLTVVIDGSSKVSRPGDFYPQGKNSQSLLYKGDKMPARFCNEKTIPRLLPAHSHTYLPYGYNYYNYRNILKKPVTLNVMV
jgi:hypothetical protein